MGGSHCAGTCGHKFGFRRRHSNGGRHAGKICFDESAVVPDGGAASFRAILPTGIGQDSEIGIGDVMVKADVVDGISRAVRIEERSRGGDECSQ